MCANPSPGDARSDGSVSRDDLPEKARLLLDHLEARTEREGELYVKSRHVADEIDLSAKEIGSYLHRLQSVETGLTIEQWGYTNGTTWRLIRIQRGNPTALAVG